PCDGNIANSCCSRHALKLIKQYAHYPILYRRTNIVKVLFNKCRVRFLVSLYKVKNGCFQSAETKVIALYFWLGKFKGRWVSGAGMPVDQGATGVRQTQNFRRFIKGLTGCVVECLAHQFHIEIVIYFHNLGVSAGNSKAKKRESGVRVIDEMGQYMCLHMIHFDQGNVFCERKGLGK